MTRMCIRQIREAYARVFIIKLNLQINFFQKLLSRFIQTLVRVEIAIQHQGVRGIEVSWVWNVFSEWQDLLYLD